MAEEKKTSEQAEKKDAKKAPAKKPAKKKNNPFKSIVAFFKSVKAEGKKVVWAKPADVFRNTIIVLIVVFIVGLAIFAVDTALTKGMSGIKQLAEKEEETTVSEEADTDSSAYDYLDSAADDATEETTAEVVEDAAE